MTDGLSTFNRFVTARAGLATVRARLGFCQIYFAAKYGLLYRKKRSLEQCTFSSEFSEKLLLCFMKF